MNVLYDRRMRARAHSIGPARITFVYPRTAHLPIDAGRGSTVYRRHLVHVYMSTLVHAERTRTRARRTRHSSLPQCFLSVSLTRASLDGVAPRPPSPRRRVRTSLHVVPGPPLDVSRPAPTSTAPPADDRRCPYERKPPHRGAYADRRARLGTPSGTRAGASAHACAYAGTVAVTYASTDASTDAGTDANTNFDGSTHAGAYAGTLVGAHGSTDAITDAGTDGSINDDDEY